MEDEQAVHAVLVPPQLGRFRALCGVDGPIEPRFNGYTKHVLLTSDRAFLFPRNHTIVKQLERECDVYSTIDHPMVPKLLGRWDDPHVSPYPFFAVTRLPGETTVGWSIDKVRALGAALGAALAACHNVSVDVVPRSLWANVWSEPPETPPTAADCYSPLRELGGAERLAKNATSFAGLMPSAALLDALRAAESLAPVLAHGDIHDDHLLVDSAGSLTGILDWGFANVISPLADFVGVREFFAGEAPYGEFRRHMCIAYVEHRSVPLPTWEEIHLAMTAWDITALAPDTATHYYWQHSAEWKARRREEAGECLRAILG